MDLSNGLKCIGIESMLATLYLAARVVSFYINNTLTNTHNIPTALF